MKTTSIDMVNKRALRTGDGSHHYAIECKKKNLVCPDNNNEGEEKRDLDHFWGWGDEAMIAEDKNVTILHRKFE